jgi:hypothetical protein
MRTAAIIGTRRVCQEALDSGLLFDGARVILVRLVGTPRWRRAAGQWRVDYDVVPE